MKGERAGCAFGRAISAEGPHLAAVHGGDLHAWPDACIEQQPEVALVAHDETRLAARPHIHLQQTFIVGSSLAHIALAAPAGAVCA